MFHSLLFTIIQNLLKYLRRLKKNKTKKIDNVCFFNKMYNRLLYKIYFVLYEKLLKLKIMKRFTCFLRL